MTSQYLAQFVPEGRTERVATASALAFVLAIFSLVVFVDRNPVTATWKVVRTITGSAGAQQCNGSKCEQKQRDVESEWRGIVRSPGGNAFAVHGGEGE